MKENFRKIISDVGFVKDDVELNQLISSVSIERSKLKISSTEKRDKLIIQTVSALSDLERILNIMSERLREWYGLHFPELDRLVEKHETYARLVADLKERTTYCMEFMKTIKQN
jgi:nucleolar protein 56